MNRKKAVIILALILFGLAIFITSVQSCGQDGGLQVQQTSNGTNGNTNTNNNNEKSGTNKTGVPNEKGGTNKTEVQDEKSGTNKTEVPNEKSGTEEEVSKVFYDEQGQPITVDSIKQKKEEVQSSVAPEDTTDRMIEIEADSIDYRTSDKDLTGQVVEKKMYYCNSSLYTALLVLAEDGNEYIYYVPYSAYQNCHLGDEVVLVVRVYYAPNTSIREVLSLTLRGTPATSSAPATETSSARRTMTVNPDV